MAKAAREAVVPVNDDSITTTSAAGGPQLVELGAFLLRSADADVHVFPDVRPGPLVTELAKLAYLRVWALA